MKTLVPLTFAALLLSSTAVLAQSIAFENLDSNGDDKLSYSDLVAQWPDLTQEAFDAADVDVNDFIDPVEFEGLGAADVEVAATGTVSSDVGVDLPAFELLDGDGNEMLSIDDLTSITGLTQEAFDEADTDNDDFLDRSQYENLKVKIGKPAAANTAVGLAQPVGDRPLFENLDKDGDGKLDFTDLKTEWPDLSQEAFDGADIDNDDFLDKTQYEGLAI